MGHSSTAVAYARATLAVIVFGVSLGDARPSAAATTAVDVQWTHLVKATATASSLKKTGGCGSCPDAGGTSAQSITTGEGYVEFTAVAGQRVFAGLGATATSNTNPGLINYAFSFWEDGGWDVREKNVYKADGRFVTGDRFRVAVSAGVVRYYKNGALVYTSRVAAPSLLVFDTTLVGAGAEVRNASITSAAAPAPPPPVVVPVSISTTALPGGALSQTYAAALQASGGQGLFVWSAAGALPGGLTLASSGAISGVPVAIGHFTFAARATDATNASNFAERSLSIDVVAPTTLTIGTTSLAGTRVDDFYTASLRATGGGGAYRWSVVNGALPPGLSLDAVSGTIQGTPSRGGRYHLTVRATDAANSGSVADRPLDLTVLAAAPPSVYSAISDRVTRAKGPTPALGRAGYTFTDPAFGSRLLRVTDGAVQPSAPDISYRTPSGTHSNAWSADARYFFTLNTYGNAIPFAFDRTTMRATRLQPTTTGEGGLTLSFFNEPTFSYVTPGVLYATYNGPGSNLHSVDQYDIETGQYSQLMNLESLAPSLANTYTGGIGASAGAVERIMAFFGGTSQDYHFYLLVFDKNNPSRRHLVNTTTSTIDGQPTNIPLNFKIHAAAIDRSGEFVVVYPTGGDLAAPRQAAPAYVWDLVTNRFTALPLIQAISGGHDGYGYGVRVNQDCCTKTSWDAAQWQFRSLINPLVTFDLITTVLQPKEIYLDDHPSWHNAQPDRLVPFIDSNYREGDNTTPWRAWDEEVFAVQTEAAGTGGTVWRFAHHRSAVASDLDPMVISFWNTPRANVSPDGRWALFTSNWDKTLGIDPRNDADGKHRQDVFLVELVK